MSYIGQMERFHPFPFAGSRPRLPDNGPKAFHEGRLETGRPRDTCRGIRRPRSLGTLAEKVWAMGGGCKGYRQPQIAKIATGKT